MTVRELIHHLRTCQDQDALVVIQKDAEGNGFSPLREFESNDPARVERYVAETTWCGEVYGVADGAGGVACVVLVPVN